MIVNKDRMQKQQSTYLHQLPHASWHPKGKKDNNQPVQKTNKTTITCLFMDFTWQIEKRKNKSNS